MMAILLRLETEPLRVLTATLVNSWSQGRSATLSLRLSKFSPLCIDWGAFSLSLSPSSLRSFCNVFLSMVLPYINVPSASEVNDLLMFIYSIQVRVQVTSSEVNNLLKLIMFIYSKLTGQSTGYVIQHPSRAPRPTHLFVNVGVSRHTLILEMNRQPRFVFVVLVFRR